jgi:hypothetical protein
MTNSDKNNSCMKEANPYKYTKNSVTIENKDVIKIAVVMSRRRAINRFR